MRPHVSSLIQIFFFKTHINFDYAQDNFILNDSMVLPYKAYRDVEHLDSIP